MFKSQSLLRLPDVLLITNDKIFRDGRGTFFESYREKDFKALGIPNFVQGNVSTSASYTLRGMHYQTSKPQGKFIRVLSGSIYDVAVDMRKSSKTFGAWDGMHLNSQEANGLYIPPGFAHGFLAGDQGAVVVYETTTYHDPGTDRTLLWNDPTVAIKWPAGRNTPLLLSPKDRAAPRFDSLAWEDFFE